ncbi:MAG: uracil-DNA glycosylase [Thermoprotei archaeon]
MTNWDALNAKITDCTLCPRLVSYRESVALTKKKEFASWNYWGKPLTGFGCRKAKLMIVGLAPAAHGGNRTGRMFTGDSSGSWLIKALFKAGLANLPDSVSRDDGLALKNTYITAIVRCAPPKNKPSVQEISNCRPYLKQEIAMIKPKVFLTLGYLATNGLTDALGIRRQPFKHGAVYAVGDSWLVSSYHPSRQNTNTGRLTEAMLDSVIKKAKELAGINS